LNEKVFMRWWISNEFIDWLIANAWRLCTLDSGSVVSIAFLEILSQGYLRIDPTTIYDAVGAGDP